MTSQLTGDFDLCVELAESTVAAFVNAHFEGKEISQPIEQLVGNGIAGRLVIELAGATAEIGSKHLSVTLRFADSGLDLTLPHPTHIAPLSGTAMFVAPVAMATNPDGLRDVRISLSTPDLQVNVQVDQPGLGQLQSQLAAAGVVGPVFLLADAFRSAIAAESFILLPLFSRSPADSHADGALQPLTLVDANLKLLPAVGGRPGAVCLLGTLLRSHTGRGAVAQKSLVATDVQHQGSLTLSPDGFHDVLHCPALGRRFNVPVPRLCEDCGHADSIRSGDLTIKKIDYAMQEQRIHLNGSATTGGTGWSADITFAINETFSVQPPGSVQARLALDGQPTVSVSLDWWVSLLSAITLGAVDLEFIEPAIEKLVDTIVAGFISNEIGNGLQRAFSGLNVMLGTASLQASAVAVHPAGLLVQGTLALPVPQPVPATLELLSSVVDESDIAVGSGTETGVTCAKTADGKPQSYPYTDYSVHRTLAIVAQGHRLGLPTTYRWDIQGTSVTAHQSTTFAVTMPIRDNFGRRTGQRTVHVDAFVSADGSTLTISNYPSEGHVEAGITCSASGPSGTTATASDLLSFEGQQRRYGGDYDKDSQACIRGLLAAAGKAAHEQGATTLAGLLQAAGAIAGPVTDPRVGGDPLGRQAVSVRSQLGALAGAATQLGLDAGWLQQSLSDLGRAGG